MNLTKEKKFEMCALISGIIFALYALLIIIGSVYFTNILLFLAYGALAAALLMKRTDKLLAYAAAAPAVATILAKIIKLISKMISSISKANDDIPVAEEVASRYYDYSNNFLYIFANFLLFVATVAFALIIIEKILNPVPKYKDKILKFWYIPSAIFLACGIIKFIAIIIYYAHDFIDCIPYIIVDGVPEIIGGVFEAALFGMALIFAVKPDNLFKEPGEKASCEGAAITDSEGYISIAAHVLLLIFTFGIWNLVWIYKTTKYLNKDASQPQRDPTVCLLLSLFIPIYTIFWSYKSAQRCAKLLASKGKPCSVTTITVFSAITPIVAAVILQDSINANSTGAITATPIPPTGGKRDLLGHTVLLVITFGIYQLYWIYKTTAYLNASANEKDRDAAIALLLSLFIPFYNTYWAYKSVQRAEILLRANGKELELTPTVLISGIIPLLSFIMLQDAINLIES